MDLTLNPSAIPKGPFAVAFSGGGDSTALVHALRGYSPLVLIVDHGLRAGSDAESAAAKAFAQSLGLTVEILTWSPPKITAGLQAKARQARYSLLGGACRARGLTHLLTGHTEDDQAETVLMRMDARSSWRGAAGMQAVTPWPLWPQLAQLQLCRPMLGLSRAEVRAYLSAHKLPFVDDPSNQSREYARIRARQTLLAKPTLRRDLLTLSADMQAGRRQELARISAAYRNQVSGDVFGNLFLNQPPPSRLLGQLIRAVSGGGAHPRTAAVNRLRASMQQADFNGASLGGAVIAPHENGYAVFRDPVVAMGRTGLPPLPEAAISGRTLWDGRFWIDGEGTVSPTGTLWTQAPPPLRAALRACQPQARAALPLLRRAGTLIAIGPFDINGEPYSGVKSAVLPRLEREFAMQRSEPNE